MTDNTENNIVESTDNLVDDNSTQNNSQSPNNPISFGDLFQRFATPIIRGDLALAFGVVLILVVLILPLPRWLLDISLAVSMTFSVLIYTNGPENIVLFLT